MIQGTPAHAKNYPPSAASRWLACPFSATAVQLYDNDDSVHSLKGERAHKLVENGILFGAKPDTDDPDMDMNVMDVLDWVAARRKEYGESCRVLAERRYDITETGEFGTCDITFVSDEVLHIADYKNGYVPVLHLEQFLSYLCGAIDLFGPRPKYYVTVIQPNYNHIDGPIRTFAISHEQVEQHRARMRWAVSSNDCIAGKHCKETYCPKRGSCQVFLDWAQDNAKDAWYPSDIKSFDDARLAAALDHADVLHGIRDELRKEAMRRIIQQDRTVAGYKVVKARQQRDFAGEAGRAACYKALIGLGYAETDLYETKPFKVGDLSLAETSMLTVAGVERMVKQRCKNFGRGKWKEVWDEHFRPHIREFSGSLTLERAIDGRPAHTRGSEFGSIAATQVGNVSQVI